VAPAVTRKLVHEYAGEVRKINKMPAIRLVWKFDFIINNLNANIIVWLQKYLIKVL